MKKLLQSLFLLLLFAFTAIAQDRTVTGTVTGREDGLPLPGVSVKVKGTTAGTSTGVDGKFSLRVPSGSNTLVFTFIGYKTLEMAIPSGNNMNVRMVSDATQLSEVVVTALGQTREQKSLGYSVGSVDEKDLTYTKSTDVSTSLAGKVAGVQLAGSPSTNFDNATVVVRGVNALGVSNPLYVVDGTITDQTNVIMDNVASVSVLKGAAATALYGNRAGNGVVIITSKKGGRRSAIDVNLSAAFENRYITMPYQDQYAGGYTSNASSPGSTYDAEGFYIFKYKPSTHPASWQAFDGQRIIDYGADESWGPKMNGQLYRPYWSWYPTSEFGTLAPLTPQPDNVNSFYNTGVNLNNSIAFSGGTDNLSYRLMYGNQNRSLTLPNAKRDQHQIGLNGSYDVNKVITVSTDLNYIYSKTNGRPQEGYRLDGLNVTQNFNQWFQRQLDMKRLKNYRNPDGTLQSWNIGDPNSTGNPALYLAPQYWDSPYFVVNENYGISNSNRLVGNVGLKLNFTPKLFLQSYARVSYTNQDSDFRIATGGLNTDEYQIRQLINREMNYETNLNYSTDLGEDISFNGFIGGNIRRNKYDDLFQQTQGGLTFPNYFDINGSIARPVSDRTYENKVIRSVYGKASFGYKNFLYLDGTLRNDWSSALPDDNNSYLYPSVSSSFVFSELIGNSSLRNILTQGKLRASYAQVGSDLGFNQVNIAINNGSLYGSDPAAEIGNQFRTGAVRPALTSSMEFGTDLHFWNRVGLEFTYYDDNNTDQIISLDVDPTSGFSSYQINAGKITRKGIEIGLSGSPFQGKNFNWDMNLTYAKNRSKIVQLSDGLDTYLYGTARLDTRVEHRVGQDWGTIVGRRWRRDAQGRVLVGANGIPLYDINQVRGTIQPDFTGGFFNNLSYKGLNLAFSVDFQKGGLFYSESKNFGSGTGLGAWTTGVNDKGVDFRQFPSAGGGIRIENAVYAPGSRIGGVDVSGQPNATYIPARSYYYTSLQRNAADEMILDKSYVKLREVRLGYDIPKSVFSRLPVKSADVSFTLYNAWLIYAPAKEYGVDPSELEGYFSEGGQLNSSRQYGLNLRVGF